VLAYLCNLFSMLFLMSYFNLTDSLPSFIYFIPICMTVMYEHRIFTIELFLVTQRQEQLLVENERLAEETRANELRSMIGNVAHDLKTVYFTLFYTI
jgi:signal transduction histidine kinase